MGAGSTIVSACANNKEANSPLNNQVIARSISPVLVSPDRVLRSEVGLRPWRQIGFRLEAQEISNKFIVHNYGHGGDGVSLSWGCATVASEIAISSGASEYVVIGSGVSGLTTASILADWGKNVHIIAEHFPPNTTSNKAGALIVVPESFGRKTPSKITKQIDKRVRSISEKGFLKFVDSPGFGVKRVFHRYLMEPGTGQSVSDDKQFLGREIRKEFYTFLVTPSLYLEALTNKLIQQGVTFEKKKFLAFSQLLSLRQQTIVNCTGLGAASLFSDKMLIPFRGQTTLLKAQPELDYSYIARHPGGSALYMFPRTDSVVLGGSHDEGDWSLEVRLDQRMRMMRGHAELASWAGVTLDIV